MNTEKKYMARALELAQLGIAEVAPNPMVGCVIVFEDKIIGEGFHEEFGGAHAEVNAINSVKNQEWLKKCTLYVTLEPCAHHGLTPPCSDLIIKKQIPNVVIGTVDPFDKVAGKGIEKLKKAGIQVETGMLESECRRMNKRFFTFHEKKRPYVILKWAQTQDGFIDIYRDAESYGEPTWITGDLALRLVHKIRSEEGAILVGQKTALKDNPSLTVRHWKGKNPVRSVIDKNLQLADNLCLFDQSKKTIVFNNVKNFDSDNLTYFKLNANEERVQQILSKFYSINILSVIVEGGRQLLEAFIATGLWDEAHIFTGEKFFYNGVKAPQINGKLISSEQFDYDFLHVLKNSG